MWNGRWRSTYIYTPSSGSLSGSVKADVHYYEDGNVRMSTEKKLELSGGGGSAEGVVREIAKAENKFQEELNRAFVTLSEGSFKSLRRQLPVTRQKIEWEKLGSYRVSFHHVLQVFEGLFADLLSRLDRILVADVRNDLS
jgi:capping protein alpha